MDAYLSGPHRILHPLTPQPPQTQHPPSYEPEPITPAACCAFSVNAQPCYPPMPLGTSATPRNTFGLMATPLPFRLAPRRHPETLLAYWPHPSHSTWHFGDTPKHFWPTGHTPPIPLGTSATPRNTFTRLTTLRLLHFCTSGVGHGSESAEAGWCSDRPRYRLHVRVNFDSAKVSNWIATLDTAAPTPPHS